MSEFYYLVLSKFQLIKNNAIEEILRERAHYYFSENQTNNFWIIKSPAFLYETNFQEKLKKTKFYENNKTFPQKNEYYAIISSDQMFINWLALRIGYFENINQKTKEEKQKNYTSTGISGNINSYDFNPLLSLTLSSQILKQN